MPRPILLAASATVLLVATLIPTGAGAHGGDHPRSQASDVDFGTCTEHAAGTTVALSELRERVPRSVPVQSLTEQGVVFPGSDELGVLITRVLDCDWIAVTRHGRTRTQYDKHIAQVGTAVDVSGLPATPFSNDGGNGADFNNYVFGYYSDSRTYLNAMRRAGVRGVARARIGLRDVTVAECTLDRTATVRPRARRDNYGFTATGVVPDAACEPAGTPFIGNWWSVRRGHASVLSRNIPGQSAVFVDAAQNPITIDANPGSQLREVFGGKSGAADAFGLTGVIPGAPGTDMVVTRLR